MGEEEGRKSLSRDLGCTFSPHVWVRVGSSHCIPLRLPSVSVLTCGLLWVEHCAYHVIELWKLFSCQCRMKNPPQRQCFPVCHCGGRRGMPLCARSLAWFLALMLVGSSLVTIWCAGVCWDGAGTQSPREVVPVCERGKLVVVAIQGWP